MMMDRKKIAKEFAENINSDEIQQIILFGSVARGDDNPDSDIDILIISSDTESVRHNVENNIVDVIAEYGELVSAHLMSEETFNRTRDYSFLTNVFEDGVVLV